MPTYYARVGFGARRKNLNCGRGGRGFKKLKGAAFMPLHGQNSWRREKFGGAGHDFVARLPPERGQEAARLGQRLVVLGSGNRIRHDARADLEIRHALLMNCCADTDAELAFPVETQIAVTAGVRTARNGFQFVNDLHRPEFWRAGDAAARKTRRQGNEMRRRRTQTAFDRRNEML